MCILRVLTHHLSGETKAPPSHIFTHSLRPPNRARKKTIRYYTLHCWCMHSVEFYHLVRNQYYIYIWYMYDFWRTLGSYRSFTLRKICRRSVFVAHDTKNDFNLRKSHTSPAYPEHGDTVHEIYNTPPSTSDNINRTNRGNENVLKDTRCAICVRTLQSASQAKVLSFEKLQKKKPRALRIVKPQSHTHTHIQTYTVISLVALWLLWCDVTRSGIYMKKRIKNMC